MPFASTLLFCTQPSSVLKTGPKWAEVTVIIILINKICQYSHFQLVNGCMHNERDIAMVWIVGFSLG